VGLGVGYDTGFVVEFDGITMCLPQYAGKSFGLGFRFWFRCGL